MLPSEARNRWHRSGATIRASWADSSNSPDRLRQLFRGTVLEALDQFHWMGAAGLLAADALVDQVQMRRVRRSRALGVHSEPEQRQQIVVGTSQAHGLSVRHEQNRWLADELCLQLIEALVHFHRDPGLWYLIARAETNTQLKIKLLDVTKAELLRDLGRSVNVDQSLLFKKLYEEPWGWSDGEPFGVFVGDFMFTNGAQDIGLLGYMAKVAAICQAPFLTAAAPEMFAMKSFITLSEPRDLARIFESALRGLEILPGSRTVTVCWPHSAAHPCTFSMGRSAGHRHSIRV
jgi:hypothetical protein